jgi:hypothetical protein
LKPVSSADENASKSADGPRPSLAIVTSLFGWSRFADAFARAYVEVVRSLASHGVTVEPVLVANRPTRRERQQLRRLVGRLSSEGATEARPIIVPRETLYASWNRGIAASTAPVIAFWNVDDVRFPEGVLDGLRIIEEGAEVVYFPFVSLRLAGRKRGAWVDAAHLIEPPEFDAPEFQRSMFAGPFFMFTREAYSRVGAFSDQFHIAGDFDWCSRAARVADFRRSAQIAGVFSSGVGGLSDGRSSRHPAENNLVYLKCGAFEKIRPCEPALMRQYRLENWPYLALLATEANGHPLRGDRPAGE